MLAIRDLKKNEFIYYPVMDGLYLTTIRRRPIISFLRNLFIVLSHLFTCERKQGNEGYKFMVRAGVSYGDLLDGTQLIDPTTNNLLIDNSIQNNLLFGKAMIDAYNAESNHNQSKAPPFSINISPNSIKDFAISEWVDNNGYIRWFDDEKRLDKERFILKVEAHFNWLKNNPPDQYDPDKMKTDLDNFKFMCKSY